MPERRTPPRRRAGPAVRRRPARAGGRRNWWELSDEELLDWRIRDLGLELEGTALEQRYHTLLQEFEDKGLRFRPYVWLSSDWFTPDGTTGFAIPFFLAHTRLARLERGQMLEVEGGTHDWCMQLLRHEAAHALDNAYRLRRRKAWREVFGRSSEPYRSSYTPDPGSRSHVLHLDYWYSQSHPLEDFAETFAVWLDPRSRWRKRYAGWPALRKLEFVDALMGQIADSPPLLRTRRREESVATLGITLRQYYARKRAHYEDEERPDLDDRLRAIFVEEAQRPTAADFLRRNRRSLVARVSNVTGQHRYLVDHVLRDMALRGRALRLRLRGTERDALLEVAVLLASLTQQFLHGGHPRYHR